MCRYLYYLGRIRTIQLEYTEAKECLQQASRKAPTAALAFRVECTKWLVLVRLLLGEIPERSLFVAHGMAKTLAAYFELTNVSPVAPSCQLPGISPLASCMLGKCVAAGMLFAQQLISLLGVLPVCAWTRLCALGIWSSSTRWQRGALRCSWRTRRATLLCACATM